MSKLLRGAVAVSTTLLSACALQPDYQRPSLAIPGAWSNAPEAVPPALVPNDSVAREAWWTQLGDPAIDKLVAAGLSDNPTLAQAIARVDQARALTRIRDAGKVPAIGIEGSLTQARDRQNPTGGSTNQTSAAIGARLSWELDLWGRVRENAKAARYRLTSRTADAQGARLSVIGDIADNAIALRACNLTLDIRDRDIASRETELRISKARLAFGTIAPVAVANAQTNLASARTDRITQQESCQRLVNALVALSGMEAAAVRALLTSSPQEEGKPYLGLPVPPPFAPALPATVLLGNPGVVAAEREVAARWSEIGVARAERMPRIDLAAMLTGQWIRMLGSDSSYASNSVGATLAGPLFDGGAGAANVRGAQAAYREAVALLSASVRASVRDIEDALAAQQSASLRIQTSQDALEAARFTLGANQARWQAGAIAQFELEDSRRQFNQAQQSAVAAAADRARAWVALMRRTGVIEDATIARTAANESAHP